MVQCLGEFGDEGTRGSSVMGDSGEFGDEGTPEL